MPIHHTTWRHIRESSDLKLKQSLFRIVSSSMLIHTLFVLNPTVHHSVHKSQKLTSHLNPLQLGLALHIITGYSFPWPSSPNALRGGRGMRFINLTTTVQKKLPYAE
jgi:hypothetical protein